ncbi:hypothetical protein D3C81_1155060 [compost metagenome]
MIVVCIQIVPLNHGIARITMHNRSRIIRPLIQIVLFLSACLQVKCLKCQFSFRLLKEIRFINRIDQSILNLNGYVLLTLFPELRTCFGIKCLKCHHEISDPRIRAKNNAILFSKFLRAGYRKGVMILPL